MGSVAKLGVVVKPISVDGVVVIRRRFRIQDGHAACYLVSRRSCSFQRGGAGVRRMLQSSRRGGRCSNLNESVR